MKLPSCVVKLKSTMIRLNPRLRAQTKVRCPNKGFDKPTHDVEERVTRLAVPSSQSPIFAVANLTCRCAASCIVLLGAQLDGSSKHEDTSAYA
jgi:hypothetical protein